MKTMMVAAMAFLTSSLFSECPKVGDTCRYLVYVNKVRSIDDLRGRGRDKDPQPSRETRFRVVKNTDVVVNEVAPKTREEKDEYDLMEAEGKVFLFGASRMIHEDGEERVDYFFRAMPLPVDLNADWSVDKSSGK